MDKLQPVINFLSKPLGRWGYKGFYIEPQYWMAGAVVLLVFLLILTLARLRHEYVHWSVSKPSLSMLFWGFILAIIVEAFLMLFGKTLFTTVLGWNNAPKPVSTLLNIGRNKFVTVMGAQDKKIDYKTVIEEYESLNQAESEKVDEYICK